MSTVILNTSSSDNLISSNNNKNLQTIDVDDVKKQYEASTSKSVQVQVNAEEVHDGKEIEVEQEKQQQTASTIEQSSATGDAELASFVESEEADAESELL